MSPMLALQVAPTRGAARWDEEECGQPHESYSE